MGLGSSRRLSVGKACCDWLHWPMLLTANASQRDSSRGSVVNRIVALLFRVNGFIHEHRSLLGPSVQILGQLRPQKSDQNPI